MTRDQMLVFLLPFTWLNGLRSFTSGTNNLTHHHSPSSKTKYLGVEVGLLQIFILQQGAYCNWAVQISVLWGVSVTMVNWVIDALLEW